MIRPDTSVDDEGVHARAGVVEVVQGVQWTGSLVDAVQAPCGLELGRRRSLIERDSLVLLDVIHQGVVADALQRRLRQGGSKALERVRVVPAQPFITIAASAAGSRTLFLNTTM